MIINVEVNRKSFLYSEYIYKKIIKDKIPLIDIEDKSFEEIKNEYGKDITLDSYSMICDNFKLNEINKPDIKTKDLADFKIIKNNKNIKIFIISKYKSYGLKDKCVFNFTFSSTMSKIEEDKLINDYINHHLKILIL